MKMNKAVRFVYKENCYLLLTACKTENQEFFGVKPFITFFYDAGDVATEWECTSGPIMRWYRCDADHPQAKSHFFWDWHKPEPFSWSQLAVEREGLPDFFLEHNFDVIFNILRCWAEDA